MAQPAGVVKIKVEIGYDVAKRADDLGVRAPSGLVILPRNFDTANRKEDLVYDPHASTLKKLWWQAGLPVEEIESSADHFPRALERTADWIGPTLFITSLLITENPHAVQIAIGIIQDFASHLFLGKSTSSTVKLEILVETTTEGGVIKKICYEGDVSGLGKIAEIVDHVSKEQR